MTDLKSRVTRWAGVYHYEEDYFFIYSITESNGTSLQTNLLGSFVFMVPFFVYAKAPDEFWLHFKEVYDQVYPLS